MIEFSKSKHSALFNQGGICRCLVTYIEIYIGRIRIETEGNDFSIITSLLIDASRRMSANSALWYIPHKVLGQSLTQLILNFKQGISPFKSGLVM